MSLEAYAIYKNYGEVQALTNVDLVAKKGELFTLLGPSGCGKTTLLRIIAGLELQDSGTVMVAGTNVNGMPANERPVNTVFQSYALFPHLTIFENVAFGLRSRKVDSRVITNKVNKALEMVRMTDFAKRMPDQLSGGQKQRVALARALVNEPEILLLDEPMSALDAKLRHDLQTELRQLQQELGTTFILVTHDQDEALTVSDRIAVMRSGQVIQCDEARVLYENPKTRFVADFLGKANLIEGEATADGVRTRMGVLVPNREVVWENGSLAIRPENVVLRPEEPERNGVKTKVTNVFYRGDHLEVWLEAGGLCMRTAPHAGLSRGDEIWVELMAESLVVLDD